MSSERDNEEVPEVTESNFDYAKDKLDTTVKYVSEMYSKHPNDNGMTGLEHFGFALKLSGMTLLSGLLLLVHAVAPWWFTTTGGDLLLYSAETLKNSRDSVSHSPSSEQTIQMDELPETSPEDFDDE